MLKLKDLEKKSSKKVKQSIDCFNRFVANIPCSFAVSGIEYCLYPWDAILQSVTKTENTIPFSFVQNRHYMKQIQFFFD